MLPPAWIGWSRRISSLSDDMILQVLARLHCLRTAVRTGLLSRRWRSLWCLDPLTDLTFRGVAPTAIEAALTRFSATSPAGTAFNLDVCLPPEPDAAQVDSLLRAAARFSPVELVFTLAPLWRLENGAISLPTFHRATSIVLDTQLALVRPPSMHQFAALERLSVSGMMFNIGVLVDKCPRLRVLKVKFRGLGTTSVGLALDSLKRALHSREVTVSLLLDICFLQRDIEDRGCGNVSADVFILLLDKAAKLSPEELVFTNNYHAHALAMAGSDRLPFFPNTRSIEIEWGITFGYTRPWYGYGEFSTLERLCLLGCGVIRLGYLVSCCPCLRVLRIDRAESKKDITVHSETLHELVLGTYTECRGINVATPVLKQLTMEVHAAGDLSMFVSAPLVEKFSWQRSYTGQDLVFGFWVLRSLSLETAKSYIERVLADDGEEICLQVQQMPHGHVLSLDICASDPSNAHLNLARETDKLPVADISVMGIRLNAMGHVYGATLLHILEAPVVQYATRILKLTLLRSEKSKVIETCIGNCRCDQPNNWRSQSVTLKQLEVVEIEGFEHDFDLVELVLRCAQELKRMTLKLDNAFKSYGYRGCTKKIHNISTMYPSVNFRVYLASRRLVLS